MFKHYGYFRQFEINPEDTKKIHELWILGALVQICNLSLFDYGFANVWAPGEVKKVKNHMQGSSKMISRILRQIVTSPTPSSCFSGFGDITPSH